MNKFDSSIFGIIGFDRLQMRCIIGVNPEERVREQTIYLSFRARVCFSECSEQDDIDKTVCYAKISQLCCDMASDGQFFLLETYAVRLLRSILELYPVFWCWVKIEKPNALPDADAAVVELEMEK